MNELKHGFSRESDDAIEEMRDEISWPWDGPVTGYGLVERAMNEVRRGVDITVAAHALVLELRCRGVDVERDTMETPSAEY